jgi:hypothetical protein
MDASTTTPPSTQPQKEPTTSPKWRRRFVRDGETPQHALTWRHSKQRTALLCAWRNAVIGRFTESARLLRIAWTIEGLAVKKGYAFISDSTLSKRLGIHLTGIQRGLTELERDGVIVRASVFVNGEPERRIWLSSKIIGQIPATIAGTHTRCGDTQHTRYDSGTESNQYPKTPRRGRTTCTQDAARRDAERREQAARQRLEARAGEEAPPHSGAQPPPWNGKTIDQAGNPVHPPPDHPPQRLAFGPQFLDALETAKRLIAKGGAR